jgi:high mobility group protein B3
MGKAKRKSGFLIFSNEIRPKLKTEQPGLSFGQLAKQLGQIWKGMSDLEKAPYVEKAQAKKPFGKRAN